MNRLQFKISKKKLSNYILQNSLKLWCQADLIRWVHKLRTFKLILSIGLKRRNINSLKREENAWKEKIINTTHHFTRTCWQQLSHSEIHLEKKKTIRLEKKSQKLSLTLGTFTLRLENKKFLYLKRRKWIKKRT